MVCLRFFSCKRLAPALCANRKTFARSESYPQSRPSSNLTAPHQTAMLSSHRRGPWRKRHMRRRDLLAGLLASATASAVHAQQSSSKIWRVACLYPATLGDPEREVWGAVVSELRSRGYIEGKNLVLDLRDAKGLLERIPPIMGELIALRPDVIVAIGNHVVAAAQHATATIPIVMWSTVDPVRFGYVSSLARPGGNTTGAGTVWDVTLSKAFELLHLLAPAAHRVAVLYAPRPTTTFDQVY